MKKLILSLGLIFIINWGLKGQENEKTKAVSVSILSESITHLGLQIGGEYSFYTKQKSKEKRKGIILKQRDLLVKPQIGFYQHKGNHTGLIINAELAYKRQKGIMAKWQHTWAIGVGTITQFNAGLTYIVQENGDLKVKKLGSRTYFKPSMSYEITRKIQQKIAIFTKANLGFKLRYNTLFSIVPLLEIGVKYNFIRKKVNHE